MGKSWDTFDKSMFGKKGQEGANDLKVKKNFEILPRYGNADLMGFQDFVCMAFTEAIRVLKPGGHALVWAIPRTSHHTAMGLERAGFEIRDVITAITGQGFPKSLDISKQIDKMAGAERKVVGINKGGGMAITTPNGVFRDDNWKPETKDLPITEPSTPDAKKWSGYGTALKPATENWILCRKPISEKNVALNVLKWGVGGINIDGCRIGYCNESDKWNPNPADDIRGGNFKNDDTKNHPTLIKECNNLGRFPANLILSCTCDEVMIGQASGSPGHWGNTKTTGFGKFGNGKSEYSGPGEKADMKCLVHTNPLCPCYILDKQSGQLKSGDNCVRQKEGYFGEHGGLGNKGDIQTTYGDMGGASRFFYCAKASTAERNLGCRGLPDREIYPQNNSIERKEINATANIKAKNNHPTVKSIALMEYLVKLITLADGLVLDPFAWSGSTLIAAKLNKFNFIGIEKDPEYHKIAVARLKAYKYCKQENLF